MRINIKITAIVPTRKGSKGVKRKNIRILNGKPLICYTLDEALKSKFIDNILIPTDDEEVIKIANQYKIKTFVLPENLTRDESDLQKEVLSYLFKNLDDLHEVFIMLPAVAPLRKAIDIDLATELFFESDCDTVIGVAESKEIPYWTYNIKDGYLTSIKGLENPLVRRQLLPKTYTLNGSLFISNVDTFLKNGTFFTDKVVPYIFPSNRSIDIDTELDLKFAEFLLQNQE